MKVLCHLLVTIVCALQSCTTPAPEITELRPEKQLKELRDKDQEQSVVFIAGFDEGNSTYYANAKNYFTDQGMQVIEGQESLEEIVKWLSTHHNYKRYRTIHIVSHSNPWRGISLKAKKNGERITLDRLKELKETVTLPMLDNFVKSDTKIVFHACGLGENKALLKELQTVFTVDEVPQMYASSYFTVFGGKYAGHYLAKPYYGYYPTAESPGPLALAKEMKQRYPTIPMDWMNALKTKEETQLGGVYTHKFNIPVSWEFDLDTITAMPNLDSKEAIMDWIVQDEAIATALFELGIPVEKYRWRTKLQDNTLLVKGKTTVLCVLEPVMDPNDRTEYQKLTLEDTSLYQQL